MRVVIIGIVTAVTGCQCGQNVAIDDGGFDASLDASVASDAGFDAGPPTRVQVFGAGAFAALSCQQIAVRAVGRTTVPVLSDTLVTLDGGPWVEFFDGADCNGTRTTSVMLRAGLAQHEFRFRATAYGALSAEASAAGLDGGVMTFTSEAQALFTESRVVLPNASCARIGDIITVVPFSMVEVPAAVPSRFTLITALPFGGAGADAGLCTNSQFDVIQAPGSSRAAVFGFSSAPAGSIQTLTLSPLVPPGIRSMGSNPRVSLVAQCLPAGEACDGGAMCCAGTCGGSASCQ
ncbi:MAG: hypothetical protein JNM17_06030 [Archangium sp.]|nr:hypothetical protein [Archangium sp.]